MKSKTKFNGLTMDQLTNVISIIDKVHTVPQRALDCRSGLDWLKSRSCGPQTMLLVPLFVSELHTIKYMLAHSNHIIAVKLLESHMKSKYCICL